MESTIYSIEDLISAKIETLSYLPVRSAESGYNVSFSQLPAAIIHPAKIISIEGESRCRITLQCEVSAMHSCLECSPEAISELYALMRSDFMQLPKLLMGGENVVSVSSVKISNVELQERPKSRAMTKIEFEIALDYICGEQSDQRV